jgi:hypothetical protein
MPILGLLDRFLGVLLSPVYNDKEEKYLSIQRYFVDKIGTGIGATVSLESVEMSLYGKRCDGYKLMLPYDTSFNVYLVFRRGADVFECRMVCVFDKYNAVCELKKFMKDFSVREITIEIGECNIHRKNKEIFRNVDW